MTDDSIKKARDGVALAGEILRIAGDNPDTRQAGRNIAGAALTVTKAINNALLPLAAVNFAFDKAREYFNGGQFAKDLSEKTAKIQPGDVIEPKASVAGPALQSLAFAHDEQSLKELYLSLLATAMDRTKASAAHPSFVEILKQLDAVEARLVAETLRFHGLIAIVQLRTEIPDQRGYQVRATHILNLCDDEKGDVCVENPRLPAMVDNWIRLGLVTVQYDQFMTAEGAYDWVEARPEYSRLKAELGDGPRKIAFKKGTLQRTQLGLQFATAVGIVETPVTPGSAPVAT